MILKDNKQKAFTIVELLIVIVVIGILAAISIVSYNGIQDRARDTSVKNSASQVQTKIEAWNSIRGGYPEDFDVIEGGLDHEDAPEARLDSAIIPMLTAIEDELASSHSSDGENTILVEPCGTPIAGYTIMYYQASTTHNPTYTAGVC